jgi:hypothetical protein
MTHRLVQALCQQQAQPGAHVGQQVRRRARLRLAACDCKRRLPQPRRLQRVPGGGRYDLAYPAGQHVPMSG